MTWLQVIGRLSFYKILHEIDSKYAENLKKERCPYCGGPLHWATYVRKPRGYNVEIPEEYCVRLSLCCGREGCRCRALPKSVLFDGRRVYFRIIILLAVALKEQRSCGYTFERLRLEFGVDARTVRRWRVMIRERFAKGDFQTVRWRILELSGFEISALGLIQAFVKDKEEEAGMARLLRFLVEMGQAP